jgi:hypothetical protein
MTAQFSVHYHDHSPKKEPTHTANTEWDGLPFFGGRKIPDVPSAKLVNDMIAAGVPGVAPQNGRQENLAAYAKHLEQIRKSAGDGAVAAFLKGTAS